MLLFPVGITWYPLDPYTSHLTDQAKMAQCFLDSSNFSLLLIYFSKKRDFFWIWKVTSRRPPALSISIKRLLLLKLFWMKFYIRTRCLRTCHWHLVKATARVYVSAFWKSVLRRKRGIVANIESLIFGPWGSLQCRRVIGWTRSHIINTAEAHKQTFMHSHAQLHRFTQVLHSIRERKLGSGAFYSTWQPESRAI